MRRRIASSRSYPPRRLDRPTSIAPRAMTATPAVPPPRCTARLPARSSPVLAGGERALRSLILRHNGRLAHQDAFALDVDEHVGGSEVDREIPGNSPVTHDSRDRLRRTSRAWGTFVPLIVRASRFYCLLVDEQRRGLASAVKRAAGRDVQAVCDRRGTRAVAACGQRPERRPRIPARIVRPL